MHADRTERQVELPSGIVLAVDDWRPTQPDDARRTLVLTHGLASNARLWDGVARRLADAGHRTITVDQRGHGRSSKPDGPYDVPTCADDLAALIDALGLDRPAVAGQSWGGNVVLELGYRHPDLVDQIACVDGGFIDLKTRFPEWDDCARALAPPRLAGTRLAAIRAWIDEVHADWPAEGRDGTLANFEVRDDGTIAPWLTHERHLQVLRGLWEHRPAERFAGLRVPVLFIGADTGDTSWSRSKHEAVDHALATLATGRAVFLDAHHDVHAQRPDDVASLLLAAVTEPDFHASVTHPEISS